MAKLLKGYSKLKYAKKKSFNVINKINAVKLVFEWTTWFLQQFNFIKLNCTTKTL